MKKILFIAFAFFALLVGFSAVRAKLDADAEAKLWAEATDSVI
jgi:hypothetical protein